ncbi:MAG: DUF4956 domain-containing protein [Lachnospiraceae bacterium]|nr:DUF4956 domain-containing protein [Lachnospiraceae bacterium]
MSTKDVIKNGVLESLTGGTYLEVSTIVGILIFSAVIGLYVYMVYRMSAKSAFYSKDLNITMAGMPIMIAGIMIAMQSNLLVSFGMVGALSIVRFRTAVKNPLDLLYLFWSVSAGIICGVNLKVLALLISVLMTTVVLLLQMLPAMQAPLVLVLRGDAKEVDWNTVKKCVTQNARSAKQKTESFRSGQKEVIYEVRLSKDSVLVEELEKINNLQGINLLAHDGEFRV